MRTPMAVVARMALRSSASIPPPRRSASATSPKNRPSALLFFLPGLIAGLGLLKRKPWSKALALVIGVLNIANVPIGTALFAYTLWFCLQENVNTLFHRHGAPPRMGPPMTPRPPELPQAGPRGWPDRQPT